MSSSYRDAPALAGLVLAIAALCPPARAADVHFQPLLEARMEASSNPDLDPITTDDSSSYGGIVDLAGIFSVVTPRAETSIRPRLKFQEFSERDVEPIESFLDLRSRYKAERTALELFARYDRRDTNNAELSPAEFDDFDPNDPTTPETGNNQPGDTRQRFELRPQGEYRISERASVGGEALYQAVRYSEEAVLSRVDYDYTLLGSYFGWTLAEDSDVRVGAYASRYEATNFLNQTDAYGATLDFLHRWSNKASLTAQLLYEWNDTTYDPTGIEESTSGMGGEIVGNWTREVSRWQFALGRTFTPTGNGSKSTVDQFRLQYDRDLSARIQLRGAVRFLSEDSINEIGGRDNRDFARLETFLTWRITTSWQARAGYMYTYQDRDRDPDAADDNNFVLSVRYEGLGRP